MKVAVVGLGLIGGSIAKEIKIRSISSIKVTGVDINLSHCKQAMELGLVDNILDLDEAISTCEVIILATPVDILTTLIPQILDKMNDKQVLIDTGSTKIKVCNCVAEHPKRSRFVAAHPLAGTEFSGPEAALMELFKGKKNIICEKEKSAPDAVALAIKIFQFLGLETYYLPAEEHDKHMAYVSHLSHVSSFTLSKTVLDIEQDESQIFNLASTGFASTARLAKSNAETWGPIFDTNSIYLVEALDRYIENLNAFRKFIQEGNQVEMKKIMLASNKIKPVLQGISSNKK